MVIRLPNCSLQVISYINVLKGMENKMINPRASLGMKDHIPLAQEIVNCALFKRVKFLVLLGLSIMLVASFALPAYSGFASPENKTLTQPQGIQSMSTNATNIVLVHGAWADASGWNKQIPVLRDAGHKVIAVQLPLHSLSEDVETVKRAIDLVGGPITLVVYSYGGFVNTNAAYNNPNVKGLVYVAGCAPDEGESLSSFVDPSKYPKELFLVDSGGFMYLNPEIF